MQLPMWSIVLVMTNFQLQSLNCKSKRDFDMDGYVWIIIIRSIQAKAGM